ncbi:MAG: DUF4445 domain-containing protein [Halanaerobiaceae bacterium]|nr:DUF4445 domain-containing protein [Halanaerobiaceae bacterium]
MDIKVSVIRENHKYLLEAEEGENLLRLLARNNIAISSSCGSRRSCGKCKVKVLEGNGGIIETERELLSSLELAEGYRLACCIDLFSDLKIELLPEGEIQVLTGGLEQRIDFNPWMRVFEMDEPEGENIYLLNYCNKSLKVATEPVTGVYGLAVDIGTTTVAVYLINLLDGKEVDTASFHNPQKIHGADVISRIHYAQEGRENVNELRRLLLDKLNGEIIALADRNGIKKEEIFQVTVVANTTMSHLFVGVNPRSLARAPYRPVFTRGLEFTAEAAGLGINPSGVVQLLPSVSAFIGSDILADLLLVDFDSDSWKLLIDIGTNGEVVLGNRERLLSCSTAAGPAFEGANISHGTASIPGAISSFKILGDKSFEYGTIGSKAPLGICGSGLVDIIAEMLEHKILTPTGLFSDDPGNGFSERFTYYNDIKAFVLVERGASSIDRPILLSQKDVRELQLAKGALAAGVNILLKEAGISSRELDTIYIAGGFGSFINIESARRIGLLPENTEADVVKLGNGAGLGARSYLLDRSREDRVEEIIEKMEFLELSMRSDFQEEFMSSMLFSGGK